MTAKTTALLLATLLTTVIVIAYDPASLAADDKQASAPAPPTPEVEAVDWVAIYREPATIDAVALEPMALATSDKKDGWQRVPKMLPSKRSVIYSVGSDRDNGVADFKVTRSGYLLLACNFSYQGNSSGNWTEKRWTKEQFQENGWRLISSDELGGVLVKGDGREQDVFVKKVERGDEFRLRCNKYDPPFAILIQ